MSQKFTTSTTTTTSNSAPFNATITTVQQALARAAGGETAAVGSAVRELTKALYSNDHTTVERIKAIAGVK